MPPFLRRADAKQGMGKEKLLLSAEGKKREYTFPAERQTFPKRRLMPPLRRYDLISLYTKRAKIQTELRRKILLFCRAGLDFFLITSAALAFCASLWYNGSTRYAERDKRGGIRKQTYEKEKEKKRGGKRFSHGDDAQGKAIRGAGAGGFHGLRGFHVRRLQTEKRKISSPLFWRRWRSSSF